MTAPIALQLYSIRDVISEGFESAIRRVAKMGYLGVEIGGNYGDFKASDAAKLFTELDLTVPCIHMPVPTSEKKQQILDTMNTFDCKRIGSGFPPDQFKTIDLVKASCDRYNEAASFATENGLTFLIHNHWWEYLQVEGRYVYEIMLEELSSEVLFELDTYWIRSAGPDPADIVRLMGARAPLLHIKDGPCKYVDWPKYPMTAIGEGKIDFKAVVEASAGSVEWMIVEFDACATDIMEAVEKSYEYLVKEELARGKV